MVCIDLRRIKLLVTMFASVFHSLLHFCRPLLLIIKLTNILDELPTAPTSRFYMRSLWVVVNVFTFTIRTAIQNLECTVRVNFIHANSLFSFPKFFPHTVKDMMWSFLCESGARMKETMSSDVRTEHIYISRLRKISSHGVFPCSENFMFSSERYLFRTRSRQGTG